MIIAQVCLRLATIKAHSKVLSRSTMPQMSQVLTKRAIGMLTAGMFLRAAAREFNVHFSTISRLQRRFREFGSTSIINNLYIYVNTGEYITISK